MNTYMALILLYYVLCVIVVIFTEHVKLNKRNTYVLLFGLVTIICLIAAFRPLNTPDTPIYYKTYLNSLEIIANTNIDGVGALFANRSNNSIEIGFIFWMCLFRWLDLPFSCFAFINSLVLSSLILLGSNLVVEYLERNTDSKETCLYRHIPMAWLSFLAFNGILYTVIVMRAGLSIALGFCFIGLVLNKRRKLVALLLIIAACLIHTTGVTFLLIYLLLLVAPKKLNQKNVGIVLLSSFICYMARIGTITSTILIKGIQFLFGLVGIYAFGSYFQDDNPSFAMKTVMYLICICSIVFLAYRNEERFSKVSFVVIVGVIMLVFGSGIGAINREADYFIVFIMPMLIYSFSKMQSKRKYLTLIMITALVLPQLVVIFGQMMQMI